MFKGGDTMTRIIAPLVSIFMLIAEPRVQRLLQFGVYLSLFIAGTAFLAGGPPEAFKAILGGSLSYIFSTFIAMGSLFGLIAVLPGIWWLERVAVLLLFTGMLKYIVVSIAWGLPGASILLILAFSCTFVQRWLEIRRYQLAPKRK